MLGLIATELGLVVFRKGLLAYEFDKFLFTWAIWGKLDCFFNEQILSKLDEDKCLQVSFVFEDFILSVVLCMGCKERKCLLFKRIVRIRMYLLLLLLC